MTLAKGHMAVVCQNFQRTSSLKLLGQFHLNYGKGVGGCVGGDKFKYFVQVTLAIWMPSPSIYGKNLRNILLQNHWASCLETLYVAYGELVLQNLYK